MRFTLATFTLALAASVAHVQAYFLVASSLTVPGPLPSTTDNRWTRVADLECSTMTTSTSVLNSAEDVSSNWGVRIDWVTGGAILALGFEMNALLWWSSTPQIGTRVSYATCYERRSLTP